ncbi:MAG: UPF0158 family protein [Parachlamydiaceae bacterium]
MAIKQQLEAQNPLILRCNRLMEAFSKSDDERDFYLDRSEGFIIYIDLDKPEEELQVLEKELQRHPERYCIIPKLTFYETKKIMEGFINEKVYDIDTKEKLLDIIQSKEARENFLDFIYDHHSEMEKWQTFYQERSRIRIIEWLRTNNFHFVFEEDLDLPRLLVEKIKKELFQTKIGKDIQNARKGLFAKAKTYYSSEALNPRPKRGRPPKQVLKVEVEHQVTTDIYTTVPNGIRGFLYIPDLHSASSASFSAKLGAEGDIFSTRRNSSSDNDLSMDSFNQKLEALRSISSKWKDSEQGKKLQAGAFSSAKLMPLNHDHDKEKKSINGQSAKEKHLTPSRSPAPPAQKPPTRKPSVAVKAKVAVATKTKPTATKAKPTATKAKPTAIKAKPTATKTKTPLRRLIKHAKKHLAVVKSSKATPKILTNTHTKNTVKAKVSPQTKVVQAAKKMTVKRPMSKRLVKAPAKTKR